MGKNKCKSTKISAIGERMGNPMPFERVMGPNRHIIESYGDLQPIAQSMKPTLAPCKNLSLGLLPINKYRLETIKNWLITTEYSLHFMQFVTGGKS